MNTEHNAKYTIEERAVTPPAAAARTSASKQSTYITSTNITTNTTTHHHQHRHHHQDHHHHNHHQQQKRQTNERKRRMKPANTKKESKWVQTYHTFASFFLFLLCSYYFASNLVRSFCFLLRYHLSPPILSHQARALEHLLRLPFRPLPPAPDNQTATLNSLLGVTLTKTQFAVP